MTTSDYQRLISAIFAFTGVCIIVGLLIHPVMVGVLFLLVGLYYWPWR